MTKMTLTSDELSILEPTFQGLKERAATGEFNIYASDTKSENNEDLTTLHVELVRKDRSSIESPLAINHVNLDLHDTASGNRNVSPRAHFTVQTAGGDLFEFDESHEVGVGFPELITTFTQLGRDHIAAEAKTAEEQRQQSRVETLRKLVL